MLDNIITIIISFGLACVEIAIFMMLAALCGTFATTFWVALMAYLFLRNAFILHKYAAWF